MKSIFIWPQFLAQMEDVKEMKVKEVVEKVQVISPIEFTQIEE